MIAVIEGTLGQHHTTLGRNRFDPIKVFQALQCVLDGDLGVIKGELDSSMKQCIEQGILLVDGFFELHNITQPFGDSQILVIIV